MFHYPPQPIGPEIHEKIILFDVEDAWLRLVCPQYVGVMLLAAQRGLDIKRDHNYVLVLWDSAKFKKKESNSVQYDFLWNLIHTVRNIIPVLLISASFTLQSFWVFL